MGYYSRNVTMWCRTCRQYRDKDRRDESRCVICGIPFDAPAPANSATQDLLAACEDLEELVESRFAHDDIAMVAALERARAAISKATGSR